MEILSRIKDILASNINALLDKTEDPEKTIDDFMRKINSDLGQLKAETASVLANERRTKSALDECSAEIRKLQRYAEKAVESGDEDKARLFLEKKATLAEKEVQLQAAYQAAASNVTGMRQIEEKLRADIGELEARRTKLKEKIAATKAQQSLNSLSSPLGGIENAFDTVEEKVDKAYNEAIAITELRMEAKDDFDELFAEFEKSSKTTAEDELAALKEKMKKKD
ncbi:PspA/IM30 family protein [Brevibacillus reuszeri]|uniref:PspA/IM30 family protein n=1 Tax=Brevibacillus reuszeri TaxID=54915 RepID=UPI000CCC9CDB|nr:PspA/IM30 family protein [Brevibacillus reuszeri]